MKSDNLVKLAVIVAAVAVAAVLFLKPVFPNNPWFPLTRYINLGLDLKGGVYVVLEAVTTPQSPVTEEKMKQLMAVIENRVNQFGVSEPIIQRKGERQLIIELAGISDPQKAVNDLIKVAHLEFKTEDGKTVLTGADLEDARESKDPQSGEVKVNLSMTPAGAKKFAQVTAANVNRHIGIYLDGKLLQNPVVKEPIPNGKAEISGYESLEEAHRIAVLLRSGALPVQVKIDQTSYVGPMLGADSLEKSQKAGIIGIIAILVFMIAYYRLPGLIANFALVIYALIILALFAGLHVTMTLPGIAGFLLSLGMAVDANIIIFERVKEELRSGKTLRSGIDAGFKRAFVAVFDANVTTLLATIVLYYFGTGPIRGFAVTLGVGILASMFTAIVMTRWLLQLVAGTNLIKNLKFYGV